MINRIKLLINRILVRVFDRYYFSPLFPKARFHYDLVMVRFDSIGDFIIGLDGMRAYIEVFKGKRVLYICRPYTEELVRSSNLFTDVLAVHSYDRDSIVNNLRYHLDFFCNFKNISADIVINPTWSRLEPSDWVVHAIRAKNKYGCHGNEINTPYWEEGDKFYTKLIHQAPLPSEFHYAQYFINNIIDPAFKAQLPRKDLIYAKEEPIVKGNYALVGISAQDTYRIWPMDRLSKVINFIPEKYKVVLLGYGDLDLKNATEIESSVKIPKRIVNMVNKTSVIEMFNLISNSQFVIGMDSAPVHIAAAARVRSICIAHGAHFKRFIPYPIELGEAEFHPRTIYKYMDCFNCGYNCSYPGWKSDGPLPCLEQVTVDMVKLELEKLLKEI